MDSVQVYGKLLGMLFKREILRGEGGPLVGQESR